MKKIYLLSGKIKSGKNYVADILVKKFNFKQYAFADILKEETSESYNIDMKFFTTQNGKESYNLQHNCTYRDILIKEASFKKSNDINYYTDKLINNLKNEEHDLIVISDFRYPYEYTRMKDYYYIKTFYIDRKQALILNIESEKSLEEFEYDVIIDNNKDEIHVIEQINKVFL